MMEIYDDIVIVDEQDKIIGAMNMLEAKRKNILRRASQVFVFNEKGEVLIQRRSENVLHPLLLDQSVGGHVDVGEDYRTAAKREMFEELGIEAPFLDEVVVSYRTKYHFNGIYRTVLDSEQSIIFNTDEIAEVIWFTPDALTAKIKTSPEEFTRSFPLVWQDLRDKIIPS